MTDNDITCNPAAVPSSTDYTTLQNLADLGSGVGANIVGQPYNVFRLLAANSGDFCQTANQVMTDYPVQRQQLTGADAQGFETTKSQKTYFYSLLADFSLSIIGDVFILNDPVYGVGSTIVDYPTLEFIGFFLGIHPVLQKPIGVRLDRYAQFYRPATLPDSNGYLDTTLQAALPLQIVDGVVSLGQPGDTASFIPTGFMPDRRGTGQIFEKYTDDIPSHVNWSCAVPPLAVASTSGSFFQFREGDRIMTQDGARYVVINPWQQSTGVVGSQLTVEREIAASGGS